MREKPSRPAYETQRRSTDGRRAAKDQGGMNGATPPTVRYAVVGLGHIAQVAVLPAFANARRNSRLAGLVSGNPVKRAELARKYGVEHTWSYEQYDEALRSGELDAVYIALPNTLHHEYALRAARAGVHVLCE